MGLFAKKKEVLTMPPLAVWEYRSGDGWHWGFHYRLLREESGTTVLHYSREMPERLQTIPAPEKVWEELLAISQRYDIMSWDGFDRCRPKNGRTKRWLLYLTFGDGGHLRAEGCGAYPKLHEEAENEMLQLLNGYIDMEL